MKEDTPLVNFSKKPTFGDYVRSGSCLGEPQANALSFMKAGDLTLFVDLMTEISHDDTENVSPLPPDDHWINQPLPEEHDKTLLMLALNDGLYDFAEMLLRAGASAKLYNLALSRAPIHVAAKKGDARALKMLFENNKNQADVNSLIKSSGQTALHICAQNGFADCVAVLLQIDDVDVDVKDKKGQQTPLYLAVKGGFRPIVEVLIGAGADYNHNCWDKTIEQKIRESKQLAGLDPTKIRRKKPPMEKQVSDATFGQLQGIVENSALKPKERQNDDLEEFQSLLLQVDTSCLNSKQFGGYTLLQKCCTDGLHKYAEAVLDGGADPDGVTETAPLTPLLLAASNGLVEMLQVLHEHGADFTAISGEGQDSVLHVLLKQGNSSDRVGYQRCLDYILENEELHSAVQQMVNKRDKLRNTALHYATQMWPQGTIRKLLEVGAHIGMKNHWDEVPIAKIRPDTLEAFLDEFCLKSNGGEIDHDDFELTFNYSFLAPPKEDLPVSHQPSSLTSVRVGSDPESQKNNTSSVGGSDGATKLPLPETQSLWYMGQSKQHRHLLKHPVIASFLYLKWNRIRRYFNRNLRFYLIFVCILTWYILERFGGVSLRTMPQNNIPWLEKAFLVFFVVLVFFILRDWAMDVREHFRAERERKKRLVRDSSSGGMIAEDSMSSGKLFCTVIVSNWVEMLVIAFLVLVILGGSSYLHIALFILLAVLLVREFFQATVSLKRYIFNPENWMEVTLILLTGVILFPMKDEEAWYDMKRHLSAIVIVLSWAELITLVGKHPKLSRYNVYVTMFYKVMGTFFFFLCWYVFFIIAFGLGFYIMLHKDTGATDISPNEEDYTFFDSPLLALVKTSTMFVGELEFADLPISRENPLGYLFFLSFVFLIVVVLMNLLNGLAVSDTGLIQEKAEIVGYISRVETISYTESVLLGDPFNFLSNWPALKWIVNLPSCSLCAQLYRSTVVRRIFDRITGATGILLFYDMLPDKTFSFKPNRVATDCLQVDKMSDSIIASAKKITLKKDLVPESDGLEGRIAALESKIDLLLSRLSTP